METYMPEYAKQEGFAVNQIKDHVQVIRWRCIHAGRYNNHRNLPAEVTDSHDRQTAIEAGLFTLLYH
jgi:hypothetical protein